jgi:hypothetical protein
VNEQTTSYGLLPDQPGKNPRLPYEPPVVKSVPLHEAVRVSVPPKGNDAFGGSGGS